MPLIGPESYTIDFRILTTNDPKTITLLDQSNYLTVPEKPLVEVTLPGYTGFVHVVYTPNGLIVLNSDNLDLTEPTEYGDYAELPDGVYQITLKVCPYDELFNKKCHLRTTRFKREYESVLLTLDQYLKCMEKKKLEESLIDIDILIQSAEAETNICNIEKAVLKYKAAVKALGNLVKKLNCK